MHIRAEIRYRTGNKIRDFMEERDLTDGIWRPLFRWAYGSESAYNCLIDPELGARVREERALERYGEFFNSPYRKPLTRKLARWVSKHMFWIERQYRIRWAQKQIDTYSSDRWDTTPEQREARERMVATYRSVQDSWRSR